LKKNKTVLISPLDWGLGHATRVTPIINYLLECGIRVILAADGRAYHYFRKEFPDLILYRLPGIRVSYSKVWPFAVAIFFQLPKILLGIQGEKRKLKRLLKKESVDLIISDNRYGLNCKSVPSVFISHQVNILMPYQFRFFERAVHKILSWSSHKFTHYWIPDMAEKPNLSGILSHPPSKNGSEYIGALSRLEPIATRKKLDFLIMLSGPEPQRTIFEQKILSNTVLNKYTVAMVRGLPENTDLPENAQGMKVFNHVTAFELSSLICSAKYVICRSGYSTLMDLYHLQTPAVLVPTPGQTEQEYLARHLNNGSFKSINQKKFTLEQAIEFGENLKKPDKPRGREVFKKAVDKVIDQYLK